MKTYKIHTTIIDYAIEWDDLPDCETEEEFETERNKIINELPQELDLEITCCKEDLDDYVVNAITERTNWLIYGCKYKLI